MASTEVGSCASSLDDLTAAGSLLLSADQKPASTIGSAYEREQLAGSVLSVWVNDSKLKPVVSTTSREQAHRC